MPHDPTGLHHRRSVRLPTYDYAGPGLYFVTVCTHDRAALFGRVEEEAMRLCALGRIAEVEWQRIPHVRAGVTLDHHVVMPNHVHLLFALTESGPPSPHSATTGVSTAVGATPCVALPGGSDDPVKRAKGPAPHSVGAIVGQYKSAVSRRINVVRETPGALIWQRGYHERVVRDDREANRIRRYILENPAQWRRDRYHEG